MDILNLILGITIGSIAVGVWLSRKIHDLTQKCSLFEKQIAVYESNEAQRMQSYENKIASITQAIQSHEQHVARLKEEEEQKKQNELQLAKRFWQTHEAQVAYEIQTICRELSIPYVEDFPDKDPDNVLRIADEYIIFDAKSPRSDDLSNFADYLKDQAKAICKYLGVRDVRKELFLVVPDNTVSVIRKMSFDFADYRVYVVSRASLTAVISLLKRFEIYEFAESLSPVERGQIISYLGKTSYLLKRRIQVDNFFANETLSLLNQKENLPPILSAEQEKVEKAVILNPPLDKARKSLDLAQLQRSQDRLEREFAAEPTDPVANPYSTV